MPHLQRFPKGSNVLLRRAQEALAASALRRRAATPGIHRRATSSTPFPLVTVDENSRPMLRAKVLWKFGKKLEVDMGKEGENKDEGNTAEGEKEPGHDPASKSSIMNLHFFFILNSLRKKSTCPYPRQRAALRMVTAVDGICVSLAALRYLHRGAYCSVTRGSHSH